MELRCLMCTTRFPSVLGYLSHPCVNDHRVVHLDNQAEVDAWLDDDSDVAGES